MRSIYIDHSSEISEIRIIILTDNSCSHSQPTARSDNSASHAVLNDCQYLKWTFATLEETLGSFLAVFFSTEAVVRDVEMPMALDGQSLPDGWEKGNQELRAKVPAVRKSEDPRAVRK